MMFIIKLMRSLLRGSEENNKEDRLVQINQVSGELGL